MAAMLQDVGRRYVRVVNTIHSRTGTLWEGRYKASMVDTESYFLTCHRYIELNPVRAGLVEHPSDYPWSSHRYYALGLSDGLVIEHPLHTELGETADERRMAFRSLFVCQIDARTLEHIRFAANSGAALGPRHFMQSVAKTLGQPVREPRPGRRQEKLL
jgi:putative transposase